MSELKLPLALAFLFFIGATLGWIIEFLFRNLISHKGPKGRYFINPGFCKGPWLPIYGIGIAVMFVISELVKSLISPEKVNTVGGTIIIILCLGLAMNCIEFIGGIILLKGSNMRLWNYRDRKGNIMGIVCPLFAVIWTGVGAFYYLFVHNLAREDLMWFAENLAFAFFVGLFFGIFIIDLRSASYDAKIIKAVANDQNIVVMYEDLKAQVQQKLMEANKKQHFFNQVIPRNEQSEENMQQAISAIENASEENVKKEKTKKSKKNKKSDEETPNKEGSEGNTSK